MLKINRHNLYASHELTWFLIDFVMLGLLIINLVWIILDSLYGVEAIREFIGQLSPDLVELYQPIHKDFVFYDLVFVGIFLTEFMVRWAWAAFKGTYDRWYFYPFIHWYDLIGCIPTSGARALRFLRVFSIVYRLHKYRIIDLTQNRIFNFIQFYYDVFLEELSDRIVIKVISGAQEELRHGSPLVHRIQNDILLPRKDLVVSWLSQRVADASQHAYLPNEEALRGYLETVVDDAMGRNSDLRRVRQVPMFGDMVSEALERAVGDIVAEVIHQILRDLASSENHGFIEDITDVLLHREEEHATTEVEQQFLDVIIEVLDLVKDQVGVQRWRDKL
ncbi:hypothetical protein QQM79_19590 [Marinobacteraceae bacterium S3BR75-40.1]